jgi:hypothetical protein
MKGQRSGGNVDMNSQPWSGRPVVQVRPVRKANQHISGFQEAESRRTSYKNRGIAQRAIAEKLNFGSCNVREIIAGLVYGLQKCMLDGCSVSARLKCREQDWKRVSDLSLATEARVLIVSTA